MRRLRVPEITVLFWVIKGLSTAMGESTSDYLVNAMSPVIAVLLGFAGFVVAIIIQFSMRRYVAGAYWLAVVMVGVFGTMVADVLHVGFGVPYALSTPLFAAVLAANFVVWKRVEGTLSIHSIDTSRREVFYWIAVDRHLRARDCPWRSGAGDAAPWLPRCFRRSSRSPSRCRGSAFARVCSIPCSHSGPRMCLQGRSERPSPTGSASRRRLAAWESAAVGWRWC